MDSGIAPVPELTAKELNSMPKNAIVALLVLHVYCRQL